MNRGAQFNGGTRRARAQKHTDNISLFSKTTPLRVTLARGVWHSSRGRAALPGEAGLLQGRRTWAIGFTVNTKCKSASEPWEMRHDIKATIPGERRKMRTAGRKSTGGGKNRWQHFKAAEFYELWEIMWLLTSAEGPSGAGYHSLWTV